MATDHNFRIKNGLTVGAVEVIDSSGKLTTAAFGTNSTEKIEDTVNDLLTAGTGITLTYNDSAGTLQISGSAQYGDSDVEDYLDAGTSTPSFATIASGVITVGAGNNYIGLDISGNNSSYTSAAIKNTGSGDAILWFDASNGDLSGSDYASIRQNNALDIVLRTESSGQGISFQTKGNQRFRISGGGTLEIGSSNTAILDQSGNLTNIGNISNSGNIRQTVQNVGIPTVYGQHTMEATDAQMDLVSSSAGTWGSAINLVEGSSSSANNNVWSIARNTGNTPSLNFNFGSNNQHDNTNRMLLSSSGELILTGTLTIPHTMAHHGDSDTYVKFDDNRVRIVNGGSTYLDTNNGTAVLTNTTSFGGDVSGTYNAIVIADDSHNHTIANVDGLQTALDGKNVFIGSYSFGYSGNMDTLTGFRLLRSTSGTNRAFSSHHNVIQIPNTSSASYEAQVAFETGAVSDGGIKYRSSSNGTWTSWYRLYHEGHKPTYSELGTMAYSNLTGTPTIPSLSGYATESYVDTAVSNLVDSSPSSLDTLNELAAALGDDANFSTTVTNSIAAKVPLAGGTMTGTLNMNSNAIQNANLTGASTYLPGHAYSNTHDGTNVYWHIGSASGSTNKVLNLRIYNSSNSYVLNQWSTTGLSVAGTVSATGGNSTNWNTAYGWGNHASAGYLTSFDITTQTDSKYLRSNAADTASELITVQKGISSDGAGKMYSWRAVENTSSSGTVYQRIARISHSQSSRYTIELVGRSTSYGDGSYPSWGKLVGQHNNDNNSDLVFYDFKSGMNSDGSEVVTEIGQVNVDNTTTDIYVKVGSFAELSAFAHMSDGNITPYQSNSSSSSAPSGYSAITKIEMWNSNTDGSGSGLDADTLDGQQLSAIARLDYDNVGEVRATNFKTLNGGTSYFYTSSGNLRGYITAVESTPHLRIATSGNESIGFYDGGPTGTENIRISGSGDLELYQGHLQLDNALELRSKDTGGNVRTIARINNSNVLQYGWSANGHVSFMGGGSYTERMRIDSAGFIQINSHTNSWDGGLRMISQDGSDTFQIHPDNNGYMYVDKNWYFTGDIHVGSIGQKVWHQGNDGASSGLDADLLDGQHGSHYLNYNNFTNTPTIPSTSNFASLSGSNSFTNSYNEFGNNTGAVSNDGSWAARVNISGSAHSRLDLFEGGDNHRLRLYVHQGHAAHIGTISDTDLVIETNGADRIQVHNGGDFEVKHNQYLTGSVDRRIKLGDSGVAGVSTSNNAVYVRGNDDHLILNCAGNGYISFTDNGTEHMRLTDGNLQLDGKIQADGSAGSNFYAIQFSRSGSGTTTPDIWGSNNTLVLGTTASNSVMSLSSGVKIRGFSTTGGQNRDQAIYIGRELGDSDTEYFTMGWKPTARSGEQMQPTGGPYNGGKAFYIEAGSTEAGGICLDQDSVNVYGSSDGGTTFRVIDKDSDIVTFEMLQTSWDGRFKGNVIAYGSMTSISDERIKENIKPIEPVINKIKNLGVYSYNKITAPEIHKDRKEIGVIAQEIQKEFPDLVNEESVNPKETNGLDKILTVDYEHLTAVLLKGMQEQQEQIEELKSIINTLVESK